MKRAAARALRLALPLAATLAACSPVREGYNPFEWIVAWQLGRFVDLAPEQKALFDEGSGDYWKWRGGEQLDLYLRDLRDLADSLERPLTATRVADYLDRNREHARRMLDQLLAPAARALAGFDDAQVAELLDELATRRRQRMERLGGLDAAEQREVAARELAGAIDRWTGDVTREQENRIAQWAQQRAYATTVWEQYQSAWASALADALAQRTAPDFERRLASLFGAARQEIPYGQEMAKVQAHNQQVWTEAMADLSRMLTPDQRRRLRERIRELAAELEEQARRP